MKACRKIKNRVTGLGAWIFSILVLVMISSPNLFADDTEIFATSSVEPNVLLIFDTSESMLNILWLDAFDPQTDYSTLLLSDTKQVVFAREAGTCAPDPHRVTYQESDGRVLLEYAKATDTTDLCSGSGLQIQWSDENGYFYFDRTSGAFIEDYEYDDSGSANHIKVFLPYATYPVEVNNKDEIIRVIPSCPDGNTPCMNHSIALYNYNYLNWIFYDSTQADRDALEAMHNDPAQREVLTRMLAAKKAIKDLVDASLGVRFGIMKFEANTGGWIKADIPSDNTALHSSIDEIWPEGETPLAEALEDGWDYFGPVIKANKIGGNFNIDYWCRDNYVIFMTAGEPTYDADNLTDYIKKDWDGDSGGTEANGWTGNEENQYPEQGSGYLDDVAHYMLRHDARPDLEGNQNVNTFTIGFTINNSLLEGTATNGGGSYHTASSAQELTEAFYNIITEILEISNSYTAPVVPISQMERTSSGNRIYLALFKPNESTFWTGNIKKFGLATADDPTLGLEHGDVIDRNGSPATDDSGYIYDTAYSYWGGSSPDGGDAELGGVGQVLLDRTAQRNIYTILCGDYTHHQPFTHEHNAFVGSNTRITPEMLGVADETERDQVVDFVHGYDAYDEDGDGDITEKRDWILGGFVHSRPEIVHYDSTTTVIFAGANDGMLHAFDDATGEELWAFVPPDLLGKLNLLTGNTLEYFVDGSPRAYIIDNDRDGTVETGDKVILVFGERRGGNHFYALDVSVPTAPSVLWDISPGLAGFSEMGQTWCTPLFGEIAYDDRLVVFLSGGYDPNQDTDPVVLDDTMGRGVYIVDLLTGDLIWKYTHENDPPMRWSIPSDITAIDTEDNGLVDRLYVGDMGGRLWRFDIGNEDPVNWTGEMLFNANSPTDGGRKIFYPPDVTLEVGYEFVFVGTGDRAHPKNGTVVNRIYAIKDKNTGITIDEDSLVDVTDDLLQDPGTAEDVKANIRSSLDTGSGWYIRLVDNLGEKALSAPLVVFGDAYFTTYTPAQEGVDDPCYLGEGTGRLYALKYITGEAVLNYETSNDAGGEVLGREDRSLAIGGAIPSALVMAVIKGKLSAYVGIRGGIHRPEIGKEIGITRVYWRVVY